MYWVVSLGSSECSSADGPAKKETDNATWDMCVMEELNTCKCTRDQEEGAPYLGEAEKGGGGEEV